MFGVQASFLQETQSTGLDESNRVRPEVDGSLGGRVFGSGRSDGFVGFFEGEFERSFDRVGFGDEGGEIFLVSADENLDNRNENESELILDKRLREMGTHVVEEDVVSH